MEDELFYGAAYKGTKQFTQQDVSVVANATGFGAAADDYAERGIDLNEQLIMNKPATFFFRQFNDSMIDAGININDVLIVDRSIKIKSGDLIVSSVNGGDLMARRFLETSTERYLEAGNKNFPTLQLSTAMGHVPWGVVTCIIHLAHPTLVNFNTKKENTQREKPTSEKDITKRVLKNSNI